MVGVAVNPQGYRAATAQQVARVTRLGRAIPPFVKSMHPMVTKTREALHAWCQCHPHPRDDHLIPTMAVAGVARVSRDSLFLYQTSLMQSDA